jgi:hypothetical protein
VSLLRPFWPAILVLVSHLAFGSSGTKTARDNSASSELNRRDQIQNASTADCQVRGSKGDVETTGRLRLSSESEVKRQ